MTNWTIICDNAEPWVIEAEDLATATNQAYETALTLGYQLLSVSAIEPPPILRQQSPSGQWWVGQINDDGHVEWIPEEN